MSHRSDVVPFALIAALSCGAPAFAQAAKDSKPAAATAPVPGAQPAVVAQVGDRKISLEELDRKVEPKTFQALYDARKLALDEMVADMLLAGEAKARGVTVDQLTATEIKAKAKAVTDPDLQVFYDQNKGQMGGATLEQMKPRLMPYLEAQEQMKARERFLDELKKKSSVRTFLEPPRVAVAMAADDPVKGPATAPITIIEFSEFQCPFCGRVGPTMKKVEETYGDKVRVAFRHFPLPMHGQAPAAANASECAREQGKFWEYHDKLFANQQALQPADLKKYGAELKLDTAKFDACVDSNKYADGVKKDTEAGQLAGVNGTPAFFINGRFLNGAQPFEAFKWDPLESTCRHASLSIL